MYRFALLTAAITFCASSVYSQSLGEAARRAEAARRTSTSPSSTFDMRDVDPVLARQELLGVQIEAGAWQRFLAADQSFARALQSDAARLQRFRSLEVSSIKAFERFISRDPALLDALRSASVSPRDYASTHLAMALAIQESRATKRSTDALPPAVTANIAFIRAHVREVEALSTPVAQLVLRIVAPPPAVTLSVPAGAAPTALASAHLPRSAAGPNPVDDDGPIDLAPGSQIPDFRFVDFNGNPRNLSDFRGRYVLLDFWGSWCGPCRAEIPHMKEAYAVYRSRGFEILGMDYERGATAEQVRYYLSANGVEWTFAQPDSVRELIVDRFRVRSFPTGILLDPDGRVVAMPRGSLRGKALGQTLDRILPR